MNVVISKSDRADKKLKAMVDGKTIHFGSSAHEDYRIHKDGDRKQRYINRHKKNETWGADGVETAGFWSKHVLWNKRTSQASVDDINKRFKNKCKNKNEIYL